jgi:hypothetical protein
LNLILVIFLCISIREVYGIVLIGHWMVLTVEQWKEAWLDDVTSYPQSFCLQIYMLSWQQRNINCHSIFGFDFNESDSYTLLRNTSTIFSGCCGIFFDLLRRISTLAFTHQYYSMDFFFYIYDILLYIPGGILQVISSYFYRLYTMEV